NVNSQCSPETFGNRSGMSHDSRRPRVSLSRTSGMGSPPPWGTSSPFASIDMAHALRSLGGAGLGVEGTRTGNQERVQVLGPGTPSGSGTCTRAADALHTPDYKSSGIHPGSGFLTPLSFSRPPGYSGGRIRPEAVSVSAEPRYNPLSRFLRHRFGGRVWRVS